MKRRALFAGALALGCGQDMGGFSRRPGQYFNGSMSGGAGSVAPSPAAIGPDVRVALAALGSSSKLLAYYSANPAVSGAQASVTMSTTALGDGTTPPTVTFTGPLSPPFECTITYTAAGARDGGIAAFQANLGDGKDNGPSGLVTSTPVSIGGGVSIVFGNDHNYSLNNVHYARRSSQAELTGRANCTLTDALSGGKGPIHRAHGLNGITGTPMAFNYLGSYLANESGVPGLVTGVDVAFDLCMVHEEWLLPLTTAVQAMWSFSNQTDTGKTLLQCIQCGPTHATFPDRLVMQRLDSGVAPAFASYVDNKAKTTLSPHSYWSAIGGAAQLSRDGMPCRDSSQSLNRGVATNLNRFIVGGVKLGGSALVSADQGQWGDFAITQPLTSAEAFVVGVALGGGSL